MTLPEAIRLRSSEPSLYFSTVLASHLQKLNPGVVDSGRAEEILRKLSLLRPSIEGNRDALTWLHGEQSVFVPEEKLERNVRLIDFAHPENNIFQVTEEWTQRVAAFTNRADAVFLINGLPVAVVETKSAEKKEGLAEGVSQIRRYHAETPEMLISPSALRGHSAHQDFTGTSIDRLSKGKGTSKLFGADDPQGYLDKYSIAESIEDGTTVRLNYALAPSDLLVDRKTL